MGLHQAPQLPGGRGEAGGLDLYELVVADDVDHEPVDRRLDTIARPRVSRLERRVERALSVGRQRGRCHAGLVRFGSC